MYRKKGTNIQLSPVKEVNGGTIYRDAKRRGIYLALFTDPEGDSCFSIYQISWIKMKKVTFCTLKTSLNRNIVHNLKTFRDFIKWIFMFCFFLFFLVFFLQIQHENNFLPTSKQ